MGVARGVLSEVGADEAELSDVTTVDGDVPVDGLGALVDELESEGDVVDEDTAGADEVGAPLDVDDDPKVATVLVTGGMEEDDDDETAEVAGGVELLANGLLVEVATCELVVGDTVVDG